MSAGLRLSPPAPGDVEAITALVRAGDVEELGAPDYEPDDVRAEWSELGVDPVVDGVLVRDSDGALVGYGLLLGEDGRGWTHPRARGRGVGTLVAEHLEARARRVGLPRILQQVPSTVPAGRALLARRGYATVRRYGRWTLAAEGARRLPAPRPPVRRLDPVGDRAALELVAELLAAAGLRPEPRAALLARPAGGRSWWVAERDGRTVGVALGELRDEGEGHVAEVAVVPAARGGGLARALTAAAARDLAERGAREVALWVRSDNPPALATYARLGFGGPWQTEELALSLRDGC